MASLRSIEELVNTRGADSDDIASPQLLRAWLTSRRLIPRSAVVTDAEVFRVATVREGLRSLIAANNARPVSSPRPDGLSPSARKDLAAMADEFPLVLDVAADPPSLTPRAGLSAVDSAVAVLLAAVVTAVADGTWPRLKACREPSCRWAYYDRSRNRSRQWCSMDLCGNRAKARAFYQRSQP